MYQWKEDKKQETQDNLGGGQTTTTTYDYTREWSDDAINSSEFKHPKRAKRKGQPRLTGRPNTIHRSVLLNFLAPSSSFSRSLPSRAISSRICVALRPCSPRADG